MKTEDHRYKLGSETEVIMWSLKSPVDWSNSQTPHYGLSKPQRGPRKEVEMNAEGPQVNTRYARLNTIIFH